MRHLLSFLLLFISTVACANLYKARIDVAEWHLEPSALQCRLWQGIPHYGTAVFEIKAGERLQFFLETKRQLSVSGKASLHIISPFWRPGLLPEPLGFVKLKTGKRPVVTKQYAARFLDELVEGMMPLIAMKAQSDAVHVAVSTVNFRDAYTGFMACMAELYPANYQQLAKSYLLFDTNKYRIKGKTKARLDLIAGYVTADPDVTKITVYGHTDNVGRRGYNWELSRRRALSVKEYLIAKGVDASLIGFKFYGETKPRVKNNNKRNRHKNRRVLVALSRAGS